MLLLQAHYLPPSLHRMCRTTDRDYSRNSTTTQESNREAGPGGAKGGSFNEEFYPICRVKYSFLENIRSSKHKKCKPVTSGSSSDESDDPTLEVLKSHHLQQKVDKRIKQLVESSHCQGNLKFKSQRGGR